MSFKKSLNQSRRYRRQAFATQYPLTNAAANALVRKVPKLEKSVKMVKELVNTEFMFKDNDNTATYNIDSSATNSKFLLNGIGQGDSSSQRSGDSVRIKSVEIKGCLYYNATAVISTVRMILFIDKQPNGAAAGLGDVLASSAAVTNNFSPRNLNNKKRFVILKDKCYSLSSNSGQQIPFKIYKKLDMHTVYQNTSTTIADIATNSLYLWFISDESVNYPTGINYARIRYIDN